MLQQSPLGVGTKPGRIAAWLFVVAGLIVAMVVIGGITRLTESGLSITQWQPISGIIPPLTHAQWQAEFANYRRIPQYAAFNQGMTLAGFQAIFFWEYLHRLLGRVIGFAFAAPLIWFAMRRQIPRGYGWRLVALLALGGLQGALGWLMVRSGLSVRTEVAPLWLAAHLLTALFTLAGMLWTALDLRTLAASSLAKPAHLTMIGAVTGAALFVQLFYGALMAGLRAGLVTDEWPLMNGHIFPAEVIGTRPIGALMVADPSLVHFIHRWWAWAVLVLVILLARKVRSLDRHASIALHAAIGLQILLGIATVMSGVNLTLAALHQLVGALLLASTVWAAHVLGRTTR